MALLTDPDSLNQGTEVTISTAAKTIALNAAGNLSSDGVTGQCLYSFLKEEWKTDADLIKFPFPLIAITPEQFEFVEEWLPANAATVLLLRNCGFAIKNSDGTSAEEYAGVITLGTLGVDDQVYYQQAVGGSATDIALTGPVNQCVQVYADGLGHGLNNASDFDYRGYMKLFCREWGKSYAQSSLSDIGVTTLTYQAYRFPLANADDLKITSLEATAAARTITVTYGTITRNPDGGAGTDNFDVLIDSNEVYTAEEIYEFVQSQLRLDADIDDGAGTVNGLTADPLLSFVGDTLVTENGVFIDDHAAVDTNRIEFYDISGTKLTYPYVAAGTIEFNANLVDDGAAIYRMFFTTNPTGNFGTADAVLVDDADGVDISGDISGASVSFSFDYDGNVQGGRTAGTDAAVTVVAIGLNTAQHVTATGTIARSTANKISLVAGLERNYVNPA